MEEEQLFKENRYGPTGGPSRVEEEPLDGRFYEAKLRKKLKFFFLNPIEKWNSKRKWPHKFFLQIVKIALVTAQLCFFATSRYNHVNYSWDNRVTFSHLFLKDWDPLREIEIYPPGIGPFALYNKTAFFDTILFAVNGYKHVDDAIGPYSYVDEKNRFVPPILCLEHYKKGVIFGFNESYSFDSEIVTNCCKIIDATVESLNGCIDKTLIFSSLVRGSLTFSLKTVNFKAAGPLSQPDCYQFDIKILFNNEDMDGQMLLSLDAEPMRLECQGDIEYVSKNKIDYILRSFLNITVVLICLISFVLCTRAIIRAHQLKKETMLFFRNYYNRELSRAGRWQFWNLWYLMIIVNDVLIIVGTCMKEEIDRRQFVGDQWDTCSLCLGAGNLLVWFGVLRYLGFFKTYNVIILTFKKAFPNVLRFMICALIIYSGFTFSGWLILGPYHSKFRTLATTSECLFALINGDDMYATFSILSTKDGVLWWFSRFYLYSFIGLYIYVVLSLFISIISDAYDTIKLYYKEGFPNTDLQIFMSEQADDTLFSNDDDQLDDGFFDMKKLFRYCSWPCRTVQKQMREFGLAV